MAALFAADLRQREALAGRSRAVGHPGLDDPSVARAAEALQRDDAEESVPDRVSSEEREASRSSPLTLELWDVEENVTINLGGLLWQGDRRQWLLSDFPVASSELDPAKGDPAEALQPLAIRAQELAANAIDLRLIVVGFADATGPEETNDELRTARAQTVFGSLPAGLRDRVEQVTPSDSGSFLASNSSASGRAKNRGVLLAEGLFRQPPAEREDPEVRRRRARRELPQRRKDALELLEDAPGEPARRMRVLLELTETNPRGKFHYFSRSDVYRYWNAMTRIDDPSDYPHPAVFASDGAARILDLVDRFDDPEEFVRWLADMDRVITEGLDELERISHIYGDPYDPNSPLRRLRGYVRGLQDDPDSMYHHFL